MTIKETPRDYEVSFEFDYAKLQAVKAIKGAKYYGKERVWHIPRRQQKDIIALKQKFNVKDDVATEPYFDFPEIVESFPPLPELTIPCHLPREPFPFQKNGIAYNLEKKRVIIGDQPGLGKTTQAAATITLAGAFPCLVICPATLKLNWQQEWKDVAGKRALILSDRVKGSWQKYIDVGMVDIIIVNYESLKKYFVTEGWSKPKDKELRLVHIPFRPCIEKFKSVIVDESHNCKDGSTQQAKFVMGICKNKEFVLQLTGTPVVNKPNDLISQLVIINRLAQIVEHLPDYKGNDRSGFKRFINRYCSGKTGESNLNELNWRLNLHCFYRREKTEVMKDLPEKIRQVILCDITNREEYKKAQDDFKNYLLQVKGCTQAEVRKKLRGEVMVKMGILKQIASRGKMEAAKNYIDEVVDAGEKIVLFVHHKEIAYELKRLYPRAVTILGEDSFVERQQAIQRFQNDPAVKVIIVSIKAGGVGITLTAASRELFIEFPWTFAACEQCEDRTHRIGQRNSVTAAYLLAEDTIDRYCYYDIIMKKKEIAQTITGASDDVEEEIIDQLLNLFNQK